MLRAFFALTLIGSLLAPDVALAAPGVLPGVPRDLGRAKDLKEIQGVRFDAPSVRDVVRDAETGERPEQDLAGGAVRDPAAFHQMLQPTRTQALGARVGKTAVAGGMVAVGVELVRTQLAIDATGKAMAAKALETQGLYNSMTTQMATQKAAVLAGKGGALSAKGLAVGKLAVGGKIAVAGKAGALAVGVKTGVLVAAAHAAAPLVVVVGGAVLAHYAYKHFQAQRAAKIAAADSLGEATLAHEAPEADLGQGAEERAEPLGPTPGATARRAAMARAARPQFDATQADLDKVENPFGDAPVAARAVASRRPSRAHAAPAKHRRKSHRATQLELPF